MSSFSRWSSDWVTSSLRSLRSLALSSTPHSPPRPLSFLLLYFSVQNFPFDFRTFVEVFVVFCLICFWHMLVEVFLMMPVYQGCQSVSISIVYDACLSRLSQCRHSHRFIVLNYWYLSPTQLDFLLILSVNNDHCLKLEHLGEISSSESYLFIASIFPNSSSAVLEIRLLSHSYQIRVDK